MNGERLFGQSARGSRSVLHLFVGNVVDAAFATNDEVHHGPRSQAGAIAHLPLRGGTEPCDCGRVGCLQVELSERTLCRRAREAGIVDGVNPTHVVTAAERGNPIAVRLLTQRARMVGRAAGLLLDILNPETVVVTELGSSGGRTACGRCARRSVTRGPRLSCRRVSRIPYWPLRAVR